MPRLRASTPCSARITTAVPNGRTDLPAEGDPPSSEISSAWLGFDNGALQARLGRQYVNLDNQRFFTSGMWRQNPQSFDALSLGWRLDSGTTLRYLHLGEANRSVGNSHPDAAQRAWNLDANLLHAAQELPLGKLTAYDYWVDNATQPKFSWRNAGVRWSGDCRFAAAALSWSAEFARQDSWRGNPLRYRADYRLLEAGYGSAALSLKLGDEMLGGDGHAAFSSPYGSNHGFNGWTSQFGNVPASGLDDRYAGAFGKFAARWSWSVTGHNFFAQRTTQRYGSELDAMLRYAWREDVSVELDYANYHRHSFGASERELWLAFEYRRGNPGG